MKIYNCYEGLDRANDFLLNILTDVDNSMNSIQGKMNKLSEMGWKDEKYQNLRKAMVEKIDQLEKMKKSLKNSIQELDTRSKLIKQYYTISF